VLGEQSEEVLKQCEEHLAYAGNTCQQFLWSYYKSHRAMLFRLLSVVTFCSSTQDTSMEAALRFLQQHEANRGDWLVTAVVEYEGTPEEQRIELLDLSWVPDPWWKLLTGSAKRVDAQIGCSGGTLKYVYSLSSCGISSQETSTSKAVTIMPTTGFALLEEVVTKGQTMLPGARFPGRITCILHVKCASVQAQMSTGGYFRTSSSRCFWIL
jgi:hypothetical protein